MFSSRVITLIVVALLLELVLPSSASSQTIVQDYDLSTETREPSRLKSRIANEPPNPDRCLCLAQDGKYLWVETTAGAVRWDMTDLTSRLFKADEDWDIEYAIKAGVIDSKGRDTRKTSKAYMAKWIHNVVENIVVLAPGIVWVETFNGAMVIRGDQQQVFQSKEEGLAALYKTELKAVLGKILAMDKDGNLWLTHGNTWLTQDQWIIRRFDGQRWETIPTPGNKNSGESICVVTDNQGNLWGCVRGGIYRRRDDRWEKVSLGDNRFSYHGLYVGPTGTLWGVGFGRLARFDGQEWQVFRGTGRYKRFRLWGNLKPSRQRPRVLETSDGKLWFIAGFGLDYGLVCFDGKTFRATPKIKSVTGITTTPEGQVFVSSGQKFFRYDQGKWKRVPPPNKRGFKPTWPSGAEILYIYDIHASEGDTFYAATPFGLLRRQGEKWDELLFAKGERTVKATAPENVPPPEKLAQQIMQGTLPPAVVDRNFNGYLEGPGSKLIGASDDQLADDIENGKVQMSATVSYYRLKGRDSDRAEKALEKRIRSVLTKDMDAELWLVGMQLAAFGPPAVKTLLELVKSGTSGERMVALGTLGIFQDEKVVRDLLDLAKHTKLTGDSYLAIARAAILVGNPEGMDILISASTQETDPPEPTPPTTSKPAEYGPESYNSKKMRKHARDALQKATGEYDDLPGDWSRTSWNDWWKRHRQTWKPTPRQGGLLPPGYLKMSQQMMQEIAKRMEAQTPHNKEVSTAD